MEEKWYTTEQAAEIQQCSMSTIRRRLKSGDLKALKSGKIIRIPESSIKAMMKRTDAADQTEGKP